MLAVILVVGILMLPLGFLNHIRAYKLIHISPQIVLVSRM